LLLRVGTKEKRDREHVSPAMLVGGGRRCESLRDEMMTDFDFFGGPNRWPWIDKGKMDCDLSNRCERVTQLPESVATTADGIMVLPGRLGGRSGLAWYLSVRNGWVGTREVSREARKRYCFYMAHPKLEANRRAG